MKLQTGRKSLLANVVQCGSSVKLGWFINETKNFLSKRPSFFSYEPVSDITVKLGVEHITVNGVWNHRHPMLWHAGP